METITKDQAKRFKSLCVIIDVLIKEKDDHVKSSPVLLRNKMNREIVASLRDELNEIKNGEYGTIEKDELNEIENGEYDTIEKLEILKNKVDTINRLFTKC